MDLTQKIHGLSAEGNTGPRISLNHGTAAHNEVSADFLDILVTIEHAGRTEVQAHWSAHPFLLEHRPQHQSRVRIQRFREPTLRRRPDLCSGRNKNSRRELTWRAGG